MDAKQIRRENLAALIRKEGKAITVAEKAGTAPAYLSQILSTKTKAQVGDDLARRLEVAYQLPHGWMDTPHGSGAYGTGGTRHGYGNVAGGPTIRGDVPVISWVAAGNWNVSVDNYLPGHAEEWVGTTVAVKKHTYALRVRGDSMVNSNGSPSFPEGAVIVCEPEAEARNGSFVVVRQNGDSECTFKQLVKDGSKMYLKPLNTRYPILEMQEDAVICGVVREMVMRFD